MAENDGNQTMTSMDSWVKLRDLMMGSWSKAMTDIVGSDEYAQAVGSMLDGYLNTTAPAQQAVERAMEPILAQLNMPSKSEVTSLARRFTNIELRLDDFDVKLDAIQRSLEELTQQKGTATS